VTQCLKRHRFTLATAGERRLVDISPNSCASFRLCNANARVCRVGSKRALSKALLVCAAVSFASLAVLRASGAASAGLASWYGEEHRGRLMANGKRFNPDKFTAASWFYPLGTRVRVTLVAPYVPPRSVLVTITDRGPSKDLVRDGRIVDLSHAPFKRLAHSALGLIAVVVEPVS
jgi:rare lipoprotein A